MVLDARYAGQVELLVRLLPIVGEETCFALKGGTAINLFYRALPRLSVDIDLVYVPIEARDDSLRAIDTALDRIMASTARLIPDAACRRTAGGGNQDTRITVTHGGVSVKIEVSPVMRGAVSPPESRMVTASVEDRFGFAEMNLLTFEEVYAGKIVAALDRQHPRDLFDVMLLRDNEGLTDDLFETFLIYLACSGRPMHELLSPNLRVLEDAFEQEFAGMPAEPVALQSLVEARNWLIAEVQKRLTGQAADFLRSLHEGNPDFAGLGRPQAADLPAVLWKVRNIRKFKQEQAERFAEAGRQLEQLLH